MDVTTSFQIIGGGIFGVSTAIELKEYFPHASVTLYDLNEDGREEISSTHDICKRERILFLNEH